MAWTLLIAAGLFECGWTICFKMSHGFTKLLPTLGFAAFGAASFGLLYLAVKQLPIGPAYAVWTGLGAAGTAVLGMTLLGESVSFVKVFSIGLIIAGVVGLNLSGVVR
jgi:quaternary ammonium compound-resistance protein SugE